MSEQAGAGQEGTAPAGFGPESIGPEGFGPEGFGPEGFGPDSFGPESLGPNGNVAGGPSGAGPTSAAPNTRGKRRRTVLWATVAVAAVTAVLIAVIASAQPSSQVAARSPLLGSTAPAISGPGLAGGHYSLAQFRNEWVLVNFMATWCQPCQQEMPQLLKFADQHAKSGDATVLTVVYDPTNVAQLKRFLAARGARWPAVDDPSASVSYGVTGLPSSFLVAPDGVVYAYVPGEVEAAALDNWVRQGAAKGLGPA
jgi:cytochrome c biogenesis protein CcmG, thiol:disulfide interchange protein DsbE